MSGEFGESEWLDNFRSIAELRSRRSTLRNQHRYGFSHELRPLAGLAR